MAAEAEAAAGGAAEAAAGGAAEAAGSAAAAAAVGDLTMHGERAGCHPRTLALITSDCVQVPSPPSALALITSDCGQVPFPSTHWP